MKQILLTLTSVLFCAITFTESVPQGINYQAVARDANGDILMNQALTIQFSVISDITTSAVSWQETNTVTTNDYGLFTAIIGQGTSTSVGSSAAFDSIVGADIGVRLRTMPTKRGCRNSTMDTSGTKIRTAATMLGLFGLFNNLSI